MLTWGGRRPGAPPPPVPHLCPPHQVRQPWARGVAGSRALPHARQREPSTFLSRADSLRKPHQGLSWGSGVRRQGPGACCARIHTTYLTFFSTWSPVPSGPPRKVEVEPLNSTAVRVSWKLPVPSKQHGQIRGYQVTYVRLENGEPRGPPIIQDVMLAEAQV